PPPRALRRAGEAEPDRPRELRRLAPGPRRVRVDGQSRAGAQAEGPARRAACRRKVEPNTGFRRPDTGQSGPPRGPPGGRRPSPWEGLGRGRLFPEFGLRDSEFLLGFQAERPRGVGAPEPDLRILAA